MTLVLYFSHANAGVLQENLGHHPSFNRMICLSPVRPPGETKVNRHDLLLISPQRVTEYSPYLYVVNI